MKSEPDFESLVDTIASRVTARLSERRKLLVLDTPCHATKEECTGDGLCARRRPGSLDTMKGLGAVRFGAGPGIGAVREDLAQLIDHTLLKPEATREDVRKLCEEAKKYGFYSV